MLITSVKWTLRGHVSSIPRSYYHDLNGEGEEDSGDGDSESSSVEQSSREMDEQDRKVIEEYRLDDYEDEEDPLAFIRSGYEDVCLDGDEFPVGMDEEDLENYVIRDTDYIILSGVTEDKQISHLDVCIHPENSDNVYVHHDYLLSAYPLSIEWISPNLAAVGTFERNIDVWDLDIVDTPLPCKTLRGHEDSVLCIDTNPSLKQLIASASADNTVRLWDVQSDDGANVNTFRHHTDKVQNVTWHPNEASILASGGYDGRVFVVDIRDKFCSKSLELESDVDDVKWVKNGSNGFDLFISTESGNIYCHDMVAGKNRWTLSAHAGSCFVFDIQVFSDNSAILATAAPEGDSLLKFWSLSASMDSPSCLYSGKGSLGKLFCCSFCPEKPFLLAAGGKNRLPFLIDALNFNAVYKKFQMLPEVSKKAKKLRIPNTPSKQSSRKQPPQKTPSESKKRIRSVALKKSLIKSKSTKKTH